MKKLLILVLALTMILSLPACTGTSKEQDAAKSDTAGTQKSDNKTDTSDINSNTTAEQSADAYGWPVIRMEVCSFTDAAEKEELVENALNEYLISINAGVQADLLPIPIGNRSTQLTLMLSDKTNPIDLYAWRWYSTVTELVDNDQCISLEKYREIYPELWELFPEAVYDTCKVNGEQYSIPGADSFGNFQVYAMRKDLADEVGLGDRHGTRITLDDLEPYLEKAEELHPELCWLGDMWVKPVQGIDDLGDNHALGVLMNRGYNNTTVVNYYASEEFHAYCNRCKKYADMGFVRDDPLNNSLTGAAMINDGICGGFMFEGYSCDYANSLMKAQCPNYPMVVFQLTEAGCDNSCVFNGWQISSICEHPDEAMKLLYLAYTDVTVGRLLAMGIEGVTYKVDENGCAWYADGVTAENCGWNMSAPWFYPNECLCLPFETDYATYYTGMVEFWHDPEVRYSEATGFVFDNKAVFSEVKACSATVDEYRAALMAGQVDVDEYLGRFNEELRENGIDSIVAEMQKQLDAFTTSK